MIIPFYNKVDSPTTFGKELMGKWYVVYHETRQEMKFARYLHPTGWKRCCYYWDKVEEAEKAFKEFGQLDLPVSDEEYTDEKEYRREFQEMYYKDAWYDLDRQMNALTSSKS